MTPHPTSSPASHVHHSARAAAKRRSGVSRGICERHPQADALEDLQPLEIFPLDRRLVNSRSAARPMLPSSRASAIAM